MNYPTDFSTLDYVSPGHADYGIYFFWSVFVLGFGVLACLVAMGRRARTLRPTLYAAQQAVEKLRKSA